MIVRPTVSAHMLLGAVIGWGILSPLAKKKGWAPGPVDQWQDGSQGWIVWVALGVLLGDSIVGIGWLILRPLLSKPVKGGHLSETLSSRHNKRISAIFSKGKASKSRDSIEPRFQEAQERTPLLSSENENHIVSDHLLHPVDDDLPAHRLSNTASLYFLAVVTLFCLLITWYLFGNLLSVWQIVLAIMVIPPLGMESIRSMGETDNSLASSLGLRSRGSRCERNTDLFHRQGVAAFVCTRYFEIEP
jgi:Flp pilus assembly protein TadB